LVAIAVESVSALSYKQALRVPQQESTDVAYVIYTSGSTGKPKGVMLDHRGPLNTCVDVNAQFAVFMQDRIFGISSLAFDLSVYDIFGCTAAGASLVYPRAEDVRDPAAWMDQLRAESVTVWNSAPALMQLLLDTAFGSDESKLENLRLVLLSGDWIPPSMPDRIQELAPAATIISLGGATEASIWSVWYKVPTPVPSQWQSIPYGHGMANQSWQVLDEELHPRPIWVPGELFIGGVGLAIGYLGDSEKTAARFFTHPHTRERLYRTGDLGRWRDDGEIEFLGRIDFQVKIGGFRVELGEIEHAFRSQPAVQEVVVQALGERDNHYLAAWIQPAADGPTPSKRELTAALEAKLPAYMVPKVLVYLETFPVTLNGKLDRAALRVPREEASEDTSSASEHEMAVLTLFRESLHPGVALTDSFFEAGGSSLRAMQLAVTIRRQYGIHLGIGDIVSAPTAKLLAARVSGAAARERPPLVVLRQGVAQLPAIFYVHPATGDVTSYRGLLLHLPSQQPVFGLEAAGLVSDEIADATVEALAQRYVACIREVQHNKGYTVSGWWTGGLVAFEMARQLTSSGEDVPRMVLIDAPAPVPHTMPDPNELLVRFLRLFASGSTLTHSIAACCRRRPSQTATG
jgi:amino acid adenylation domain-containing protein